MNPIEGDFVPLWKGMELLGVKKSAFFYLVKQKQITVQPGSGAKDSRYSLNDILRLKAERKERHFSQEPTIHMDWMYARDLPAALDLDYQVFDKRIIASYDTYETWLLKNPHIAMCAYDRKDRRKMLAYVAMLPLPEQVIMEVVTGQRDEMDIEAEEVQTYDRPGEYVLLANSVVTHPTRPDLLYQVLGNMMQFWLEQYPTRWISRIYAQPASASGDILISKLYLSPLYIIGENKQAGAVKDAYVLDLSRPGASKVVRHFQQQLTSKRTEQKLPEVTSSPLPTLPIETQPEAS